MSTWSKACEHHRPEVLAFLRRRLWRGGEDRAEDLCQETFARALTYGSRLRDASKLRSYLLRIANNLLIDHLRRPRLETSECDLPGSADLDSFPDQRPTGPAAGVELTELKRKLTELLGRLGADQRVAFELGVLQRRPYVEIARRMGWSPAKVKINVFRARQQLMAGLRDYGEAASVAAAAGRKDET